jgi:phosphatidylserine decarboxylase
MPEVSAADLFITLQRLLPARILGWLTHRLSRSRLCKDVLIRAFVRLYQVDISEAEQPVPSGYPDFNAFFTRALKPGARPTDPDPAAIVSPADGVIQQFGQIEGEQMLQVKGMTYSLTELFAETSDAVACYANGAFLTVYLAPHNYHRVHMPLAGRVRAMTHVPGSLWSVNAVTVRRIRQLFARNERLICHCVAPWGPFAVILVGALNVGGIATSWAGEVLPRRSRQPQRWDYGRDAAGLNLERGALLGQFNLGSTVILTVPKDSVLWRPGLAPGAAVRVGQRLGRCLGLEAPVR